MENFYNLNTSAMIGIYWAPTIGQALQKLQKNV